MNSIQLAMTSLIPAKSKTNQKGWRSFNAPCCIHNGETIDTRGRGGMILTDAGGISYSCFNCHYTASWRPGLPFGHRMRKLARWMGMDDGNINRLVIDALKELDNSLVEQERIDKKVEFHKHALPDGAFFQEWIDAECDDPRFLKVLEYLYDRGFDIDDYPWYWSPAPSFDSRLIVPFYWNNEIVGYTGRSVKYDKKLIKYYQKIEPDYVFGLNLQQPHSKFALLTEGTLDAIAIRGLAALTNTVNETKADIIESIGKEIVVVPDFDRSGGLMVDIALEYGWGVAFPEWEPNVKDCAHARQKYGQLYTLRSILTSIETSPLKITVLRKRHGL